jgi:hypothetical protein
MTALLDAAARVSEFEDDLQRLVDDLESAVADIVGIDEDAAEVVLVGEDDGSISVDTAELKDLLDRLADAPGAVASAFEDFGWETRRAFRALKKALAQRAAMSEAAP